MRRTVVALVLSAMVALPTGAAGLEAGVTLVDVAPGLGIDEVVRTWSANVADYDGDLREDWLLIRHQPETPGSIPRPRLYRNTGGGFKENETIPWPSKDRHGCAWGHVNNDALLDLFCAVGLTDASKNELWLQNLDHTFVNKSREYGLTKNTSGRSRLAVLFDANNDGVVWNDVYVTRTTKREGASPQPNLFYENVGGTRYRRAPEYNLERPTAAVWGHHGCAEATDYDGDLREDLLVCGRYRLTLFKNTWDEKKQQTVFVDVTQQLNIDGVWHDAELADLNQDGGDPDLVRVKRDRVEVRLSNGKDGFRPAWAYSIKAGEGESLATGDVDGDLDLDVFVVVSCATTRASDGPDILLINDGGGRFTIQKLPRASSGCGDVVERIDYDQDLKDDFIVLNGRRKKAGPVQLYTEDDGIPPF